MHTSSLCSGNIYRENVDFSKYKTTLTAMKLPQNTEKLFLLRNLHLTQQHRNIKGLEREENKHLFLCWDLKLVWKTLAVGTHGRSVPAMEASLSSKEYCSPQLALFLILFLPFPSTCVCSILLHVMEIWNLQNKEQNLKAVPLFPCGYLNLLKSLCSLTKCINNTK